MKEQLILLRKKAISILKNPEIVNSAVLTQLAAITAKLEQRLKQVEEIENDILQTGNLLNNVVVSDDHEPTPHRSPDNGHSYMRGSGRSDQKKIKIQLDSPKLGLTGGVETICEHRASDSLVKLLERLYKARGVHVLERLSKLRVSRGPFVSNNPASDFSYQSRTGMKHYQNQSIAGSGFFALTNTSTPQKVEDIRRACEFLGLPIGSVQVEQIDKFNDLEH